MTDYADLEKRLRLVVERGYAQFGAAEVVNEAADAIAHLAKEMRMLQSCYWRIVKSERDRAAHAARETQIALDEAVAAGYNSHLPTLEEVQADGPYVRVLPHETLAEAVERTQADDHLSREASD